MLKVALVFDIMNYNRGDLLLFWSIWEKAKESRQDTCSRSFVAKCRRSKSESLQFPGQRKTSSEISRLCCAYDPSSAGGLASNPFCYLPIASFVRCNEPVQHVRGSGTATPCAAVATPAPRTAAGAGTRRAATRASRTSTTCNVSVIESWRELTLKLRAGMDPSVSLQRRRLITRRSRTQSWSWPTSLALKGERSKWERINWLVQAQVGKMSTVPRMAWRHMLAR